MVPLATIPPMWHCGMSQALFAGSPKLICNTHMDGDEL
jgi:hypothetical protein